MNDEHVLQAHFWRRYFFCLLLSWAGVGWAHSNMVQNPCYGTNQLLNIVDRPNYLDSPCTIPAGHFEVEMGYQAEKLQNPSGTQQNFPQAELRLGLAHLSELAMVLPVYVTQSVSPRSGFSPMAVALKHQLWYSASTVVTAEGLAIFGGSDTFGSKAAGGAFNMVFSHNLNEHWSLIFMGGVVSWSMPVDAGGGRYQSFNPDLVISYALLPAVNVFGEVYGQTKTGVGQGSGYNGDAGVLWLVNQNLVLDFSAGQRISGFPGAFERYVDVGFSLMVF